MKEVTKKKLFKIINKMKVGDFDYNERIIMKNINFLVELCYIETFMSEIIYLEIDEYKKLEFIEDFIFILKRKNHHRYIVKPMLYEEEGKNCLHMIAEKKLSLRFLVSFIKHMAIVFDEINNPDETITKYLNMRSVLNNNETFIHMIMNNIIDDKNFNISDNYDKFEALFALLKRYNYNFLLPDMQGFNLCNFVDSMQDDRVYRSFYQYNKDALVYTLNAKEDASREVLDIIFDGFWRIDFEESLLYGYLDSYREFNDDVYSYDFSEFASGFGIILKHIQRGHISNHELIDIIIRKTTNKDYTLLIKLLNEYIKCGYEINVVINLMNRILNCHDDESSYHIYKFLCENGFNSYGSDMHEHGKIKNKTLSSEFMNLYHSQIFIEYLKELIIQYGLRYDFEFYDVNNKNEVDEFFTLIENAKIISGVEDYYSLSEIVANTIMDDINSSIAKRNDMINTNDILNAIKKIVIDNQKKYINNIEIYKQKILEKSK